MPRKRKFREIGNLTRASKNYKTVRKMRFTEECAYTQQSKIDVESQNNQAFSYSSVRPPQTPTIDIPTQPVTIPPLPSQSLPRSVSRSSQIELQTKRERTLDQLEHIDERKKQLTQVLHGNMIMTILEKQNMTRTYSTQTLENWEMLFVKSVRPFDFVMSLIPYVVVVAI